MIKKQLFLMSIIAAIGACGADDDESKPTNNTNKPEDAAAETSTDAGSDKSIAKAVEVVDCAGVTAEREASMEAIAFKPAELTISPGQVVRWTNNDAVAHTVTSGRAGDADGGDLFDSGNLSKDATYCLRFNNKGTYNYWCRPHPTQMNNGVVTVE